MPVKTRWALNPRKWFGIKSKVVHKQDTNTHSIITRVSQPPPTATTTRTVPRIFSGKTKTKVVPSSISNDIPKNTTTITQLQLPAFSIRRERTSTTLNRQMTFHPTHTEPTIRKISRIEQELFIDTTRYNNMPQIPMSIYENFQQNSSSTKEMNTSVSNISNRCLIDYPRHSANRIDECSLPSRSSSTSSIMDDNDNSSSSGIFTDERQHTESPLEVLSVESIADSQTSLNHSQTRPIIHHYRRPMSVFQSIDDKSEQRQKSLIRSHRSQSAEGILKDNQINSIPKSRQSSAAIIKKIEKRCPTSRSPSATLEKAGFIRITNDTYRLTNNKITQASTLSYPRKTSVISFVPYSNYDDPLRSANDEECYATLPRTSSTEQLNNINLQNDLRIIVDECIRPMVNSIGKNRLIKTQHRYKRSNIHTQFNIENITDKLLSSIDDSIYTRYQRCN